MTFPAGSPMGLAKGLSAAHEKGILHRGLKSKNRPDPISPYETARLPLFRLLGSPPEQKRHETFPSGHSLFGWRDELHREALNWLARHFGPPLAAAPEASPPKP